MVPWRGSWSAFTAPEEPNVVLTYPKPAVVCPPLDVCVARELVEARIRQPRPVQDVGELRRMFTVTRSLIRKIRPTTGFPPAAAGSGNRRSTGRAKLARGRLAPGCLVEHEGRVRIETVAIEIRAKQGLARHAVGVSEWLPVLRNNSEFSLFCEAGARIGRPLEYAANNPNVQSRATHDAVLPAVPPPNPNAGIV